MTIATGFKTLGKTLSKNLNNIKDASKQATKVAENEQKIIAKETKVNPTQTVKNSTTTPAGTKADAPTTNTKTTEVNAVKTTKSNSLGKVLGVSALVGGSVGTYTLMSSLNKAESPISETENPNNGNNTNPNGNGNGNEDDLPDWHIGDNEGDEFTRRQRESQNGEIYGGTLPGGGYYTTSGDSEGEGLSGTIEEIISATSNYLPYILIGIAVLVGLYVVTKKGKKTGKKTTLKIGGVNGSSKRI